MFSSKAIQVGTALGLFITGSHAGYVYPRGFNSSTPVTPAATPAGNKTTSQPSSITSCPVPTWTYTGSALESIYDKYGVERYERSFLSMYNNFLRDDAEFERVAAASTLIHATDPAVVSKVLSYFTSLYSATASEVSYLYGPSYEGALDFFQTTDPCLFTTCTNQYWSHKSASSTGVWFNTAAPPCCGECTVYADGVQLFYWPTPNPTPSVTAYQLGSSNATLYSPTVLVYMTDIYAEDNCNINVGSFQPFGFGYFDPSWLSTSSILTKISEWSQLIQTWTAIDFADFGSKCTCTTKCKTDSILGPVTDLCTPQLSMPGGVRALDPAWATCAVGFQGVFDPPIALQQMPGFFTPVTTPATEITLSSTVASPSPSPTNPIATPTLPQSVQAPTTSSPPVGSPNPPPPPPNSVPAPNSPAPNSPAPNSPAPNSPASNSPAPASPSPAAPNPNSPNPNPPASIPVPSPAPTPVLVAGSTVSVNPSGFVVIAGTTLTPGGSTITISGTAVSLAPAGTQVVIAGTTSTIGGAIITPATSGLVKPSQVVVGSGGVKVVSSELMGKGMLSLVVGLAVGVMMWL